MTLSPTFFLDFSLLCIQSFLCSHKQEYSNTSSIISILESSTLLHSASNKPHLKPHISLNGFTFSSLSEMALPNHYDAYSLSFRQRPHFWVCLSPSSDHLYRSSPFPSCSSLFYASLPSQHLVVNYCNKYFYFCV